MNNQKTEVTKSRDTSGGEVRTDQVVPRVEYAEGVDEIADVSVNIQWFADFLRQNGVSDEEIQATTILVMSDFLERAKKPDKNIDDEEVAQGGYYDPPTRTIAIDIAEKRWLLVEDPGLADEPDYPYSPETIDMVANSLLSEDAIHEAVHRVQHARGKDVQSLMAHYDKVVPEGIFYRLLKKLAPSDPESQQGLAEIREQRLMGAIGANHEWYLNEPDEIEARRIAKQEIEKLEADQEYPIRVRFKYPDPAPKSKQHNYLTS